MTYIVELSEEEYQRLFDLVTSVMKTGWTEEKIREADSILFLIFYKAKTVEKEEGLIDRIKKVIKK